MSKVDFIEVYTNEKYNIKLTKKGISKILNGEILEGFKTRIGLEVEDGSN